MNKKFIISWFVICLLFFSSVPTFGQILAGSQGDGAYAKPNYFPGSPDVMQANEYQNRVENFTGTKTITLPIYSFESGSFKLPISLSYNTQGVKLTDMASWVGLKWNLNCGGIITRMVKDIPDEEFTGRLNLYHNGIFSSDSIAAITDDNSSANADRISSLKQSWYDGNTNTTKKFDKEPDVFSFTINGQSGKFVLKENGEAVLIPFQNLRIVPDVSDYYDANQGQSRTLLEGFTIIDDNGVQYIFSETENTEIATDGAAPYSLAVPVRQQGHSSLTYVSAWFLTRIVLPITKLEADTIRNKTIGFTYTNETYSITQPRSIWGRQCSGGDCSSISLAGSYSPNAYSESYETISGKRLTSISDGINSLNFVAEERNDISSGHRLKYIYVAKGEEGDDSYEIVKSFLFNYHYYDGTLDDTYLNSINVNIDLNNYGARLMLESVSELEGPDELTINPNYRALYSFEYDESAALPSRFSFEQDFWGYYNANGANSIFPKLYVYPNENGRNRYSIYAKPGYTNTVFEIDGPDRNPNSSTIGLGTLNKVKYKTGGTTSFEYEPNDFYFDGANHQGCGMRVKKTKVYDGIDHSKDIIKEYTYTRSDAPTHSSGILINMPVFSSAENIHPSTTGADPDTYTDPASGWYYNDFLSRNSLPDYSSGSADEIDMGYTEIVEKNSDNSYTYYKYSLPGYSTQDLDDDVGVNCFLSTDGYCDGLFHRFFSSYCATKDAYTNAANYSIYTLDPDLAGYDFTGSSTLPFSPAINYDWNRGLLLEKKDYDADDFLHKEEIFNYSVFYPEGKTTPDAVNGLVLNETDNWKLDPTNNISSHVIGTTYSGMDFFSKYDIIGNVAKVLNSKTEKVYDKLHSGQFTQTQVSYQHNGYSHSLPTKIISTDSRGVEYTTENTYALDLADPPNNYMGNFPESYPFKGYRGLVYKNINALMKTMQIIKYPGSSDELVVGANISYYDADLLDGDDRIYSTVLLKEQKFLHSKVPILRSTLTDNISNSGIFVDSRYTTENLLGAYDELANPMELANLHDKKAIIWGYNKRYPVAQVANAVLADIAYSSFESEGSTGGWTYDGSLVDDNTVPTGKKCFNFVVGDIASPTLSDSKVYIVSYWSKNGQYTLRTDGSYTTKQGVTLNGWTFYENILSGATGVAFTASSFTDYFIDELRLYPKTAQMITYCYEPLVGITSQCDINNIITYFEYNKLEDLTVVRNQDKMIIEKRCQSFQNQLEGCIPTYYNPVRSEYFTKSCGTGYRGTKVLYTVHAGTFSSLTSQEDATQLALDDISANGQSYANAHGDCVPITNYEHSQVFTRNNCTTNFVGVPVTYTVPAGTYPDVTQTGADQQALDDIAANGQNYANTHGACICPGPFYKVINGACELGTKICIKNVLEGRYNCFEGRPCFVNRTFFKVIWSDGSTYYYSSIYEPPCP